MNENRKWFPWIIVGILVLIIIAMLWQRINWPEVNIYVGSDAEATATATIEPIEEKKEEVIPPTSTPDPTATPTSTPVVKVEEVDEVVPLSWFEDHGIDFSKGVTVAYTCETGARAWQGYIPAMIVPEDGLTIRMDHECDVFEPGSQYPGGNGTVWFDTIIDGTFTQKGNCSCKEGENCP